MSHVPAGHGRVLCWRDTVKAGLVSVEIVMEDVRWQEFELTALAKKACDASFEAFGLSESLEVSLLACDDARIADLNAEFRGKPVPTNVLSWPSQERGGGDPGAFPEMTITDPEIGDIAIAYETCQREAEAQGKEPADHVTHLLVHAVLHLLGFDHELDADARLMEHWERQILAKLGLSDPYIV